MSTKDVNAGKEVREAPRESRAEDRGGEAARDSQERPQDLVRKERQHDELRRQGRTPSSIDLPRFDLFESEGGQTVARVGDREMRLAGAADSGSRTADQPEEDAVGLPERSEAGDGGARLAEDRLSGQPGADTVVRPGDARTEAPPEVDPARLREIHEHPQVAAERGRLSTAIEAKITDPAAQERVRQDIEAFERRAASADPPLSPDEVARTYQEVTRLLDARDNPDVPLTAADRAMVAEQILHHAADPSSIDQGSHGTCGVATIENRMFARNPAAAAELVTQVATEGHFVTPRPPHQIVEINPESLRRHPPDSHDPPSEESHNPPLDGKRSYASQLFQVAAVNLRHQTQPLEIRDAEGHVVRTYPPGSVEYRQVDPTPGSQPPNETGELLVDTRTGQPVQDAYDRPIHSPYLQDADQIRLYNEITGAQPPEAGILLANSHFLSDRSEGVTRFDSVDELRRELESAVDQHRLPVILKVNTGQEPFFTDSGGGAAGGSGGAHVVCVTGFNRETGEVQIDNQWGSGSDHTVDIEDLYRTTMSPSERPQDTIAVLERECAENARNGRIDYGSELELLRLRRATEGSEMSDTEFDRQLVWLTQQIVRDAQEHHNGVIDPTIRTEWIALTNTLVEGDRENGTERVQQFTGQVWESVIRGINDGNVSRVELPDYYGTVQMEQMADHIYNSTHWYGNETENIYNVLRAVTPAQYRQMDEIFRRKHNQSIEQYLQSEMWDDDERGRAMTLLRRARGDPPPARRSRS